MDVFFEQIIKKEPNGIQKSLKIGFILVAVLFICYLIFLACNLFMIGSILSGLCILIAFGVGWGCQVVYRKNVYGI